LKINQFIILPTLNYFILSVIFSFSVTKSWGQSCVFTLEGKITDLHDDSPIFGAVVKIEGSDLFGQTNEEGYYRIEQVCDGSFTLFITHPMCNSVDKKITIRSDLRVDVELEHHISELKEIILAENAIGQLNQSLSELQLDDEELTKLSNQNLAETLQNLAGVSSLKTGSSIAKPMIHGLYGSRVAIVANGMRLQDQEWGADHAPNIDPIGFESIQVIKGAAALKYGGDAAGGMIVLSPQKLTVGESLSGNTVLNGVDNGKGGSLASKISKSFDNGFFFKLHLNAKQFGDRQAPEYRLTNTGLKESTLGVSLGKTKISKGWQVNYRRFQNSTGILRSAHIGNIEDLLRALESNVPIRIEPFSYKINAPKQQALLQNFQTRYFYHFSNEMKLELDYNFQQSNRKEFDVRRGNRSDLAAIDITLKTHDFLGSIQWKKDFEWNFEWGINGLIQDNFSNPETGVKRLVPDYLKYQLGSFITGKFRPSNLFSWEWGVRFDQVFMDVKKFYDTQDWIDRGYNLNYKEFEMNNFGSQILVNPQLRFGNISAQSGLSIQLNSNFKTTLSYMLTQRAPNVSELFSDGLHHSLATIEYGNLDLQKETSHKFIFGLRKDHQRLSFGIDPYLNWIKEFIYIEPSDVKLTIRGAFPVWEYKAANALMWGWDTHLNFEFSEKLNYFINAAYTYGQDVSTNKPLISIPPFNLYQKLTYSLPKPELEIELAHSWVTSQHRFPDTNFYVDRKESEGIVQKLVDVSTPPPGYHNLDLFFSLPLTSKGKLNSTFRLILQNLTNASYRNYLNRLRYYSSEMGRTLQLQLVLNY
jgi:iron complex outermembrane receptor protein